MRAFDDLQQDLAGALEANRSGSEVEHVLVVLPSYSVGESLLSHYADRIPALEHRFLVCQFILHRQEHCHLVYVSSKRPDDVVLDYYARIGAAADDAVLDRFHVVEVPDPTPRAVAPKLLERTDLLDRIRELVDGRPAFIEGWNVTAEEVEVARRLDIPINGTDPELWFVGFKSEGRRLFRSAGVPVPYGVEDVTSPEEVLAAIHAVRSDRPRATGVIVKLDDSGAGDGNVVLDLRDPLLEEKVRGLPDWYLRDLAAGGVVEERISGTLFSSPSAQIDLLPGGEVSVLATHEQVLGGPDDQVYMGCRFPAEPEYAAVLGRYAEATGKALATRGALGRVGIDFAVARDERGDWNVFALEMNLRKGGTTHPYTTLRHLVPGRYDPAAGRWVADDGSTRAYSSTDNLVDPDWTGLDPADAIAAVADAGLEFDCDVGTGVVLHMLTGLSIDGRLGLTAIGHDPAHAAELHEAAAAAIGRAAS